MRRIACLVLTAALAGAANAQTTTARPPPTSAASPPPASGKVQTTDEANRESIAGAAESPLRDLNLVRTKIPLVLLDATADPYKRPAFGARANRKADCTLLTQLVRPLNDALGADLDAPSRDQDDLLEKGRGAALGVAASFASDTIPFRGWVRQLSGAERHDRIVQAAIIAGAVRRGYLKGLGEARGCDPPATPSHELTAVRAAEKANPPRSRFEPRYPIR
jgi:hypothetical protein